MNKKFFVIICMVSQICGAPSSLSSVLQQYEKALADLNAAAGPTASKVLDKGSLAFATYKKIIAPYVAYINGYALVVQSEVAHHLPYDQDLKKMSEQYVTYQKEVVRVSKYFPSTQQDQAVQFFYEELGSTVVQICFNIVQQISYALTIDPGTLASCYIAYQLAMDVYVTGMSINGVAQGATVPSTLSDSMVTLYQAAISQRQNELSTGLTKSTAVQDLYDEIGAYYIILATVYKNAGNDAQATSMISQAQAVKKQFQDYQNAQKLYATTNASAKASRIAIVLDVNNPIAVQTQVTASQQQMVSVYKSYQQAQEAYQSANDPIGQQQCAQAISLVTNIDLVVRALDSLWLTYLNDQSGQSVYTAPTIALFIKSNVSGQITTQDVQASFQNLANFITQPSNSVSQLASAQLTQYSMNAMISLLEENSLNISQSTITKDTLVDFATIQNVELIVKYLALLSQSMVNAYTQTGANPVALAMTYAQEMDKIYPAAQKNKYQSLVPYFPDQLSVNATWKEWIASVLVASNLVASKQDAYSQAGKATMEKPVTASSKVNVSVQTVQAQAMVQQAQTAIAKGDFTDATQQYEDAYNAYHTLYAAQAQTPQAATVYAKAILMRTLLSASSFASTVQMVGDVTWNNLKSIPEKFVAREYQFQQISMTDLGGTFLPSSLQSLALSQQVATVSAAQEQDIFAVLRAYVVSQLLQLQGVNFTDCFVDYSLTLKSGISADIQSYANSALDQVQTVLGDFKNCTVVSITLQDEGTILAVNCGNVPLSPATPLYSTMATAVTFLDSAYLLFSTGTQNIDLGGTEYVPGNNVIAADEVLQSMVYAYLSEAYDHFTTAQDLMQHVTESLVKNKPVLQQTLPTGFSDTFTEINKNLIRAQALLFAPTQSAYAYAQQMSIDTLAVEVKDTFLDIYQVFIAWMKQCLVGAPFINDYQMLLHQINEGYVNWASMLDPKKDAATITKFNMDIAQLFEDAGNSCMQISYTQPLYPNFKQMHYATAAHYFLAAKNKYQTLKQTALVAKMTEAVNTAYFNGGNQNISLYFHAKVNGVTYTSAATGQAVPISVAQLAQDNVTGFVDSGEQDAYNSVKNLLLNAGMAYEFIANEQPQKATVKSKTPAAKAAKSAKAKTQQASALILYLRSQKVIASNVLEIPYSQPGLVEKIFNLAQDGYEKFQSDPVELGVWMSTMLQATQNLYAQDYLGATGKQTGAQAAQQAKAFFQALQDESSSLENPSSIYVN